MTKTEYAGPATAEQANGQPVEKVQRRYAGTVEVHSVFYTIQGEGPFCGVPAVFVRLAGCNLQCPWCDTEYTEGRQHRSPAEIVAMVTDLHPHPRGLVVISGGEPFRQQIGPLMKALTNAGFYVQIETNGTLPPPDGYTYLIEQDIGRRRGVYVVCSPKTGKTNAKLVKYACCFKYVLDAAHINQDDGLPTHALGHTANPQLARPPELWKRPVYLQPADHKNPELNYQNMIAATASALKHGYTLQLQIHKYLGLE